MNLYQICHNSTINSVDLYGYFKDGTTAVLVGGVATLNTTGAVTGSVVTLPVMVTGSVVIAGAVVGSTAGYLVGELVAPYVIPEPSDIPGGLPDNLKDKRTKRCLELLGQKISAKDQPRMSRDKIERIKDSTTCCKEAERARDALQEEVDVRQKMENLDCDSYIPTKTLNHPKELADKKTALERAKKLAEEKCK